MTRSILYMLCLLAALSLCSCGGSQPTESADQPGPAMEHTHDADLSDPSQFMQVIMQPAEQVELPFEDSLLERGISTPREQADLLPVIRRASFEEEDLLKDGADFDEALAIKRVAPDTVDPAIAHFDPDWPALDGDGIAYCLYNFPIPGYGTSEREPTIGLDWETPPAPGNLFIGLGNRVTNRWEFYAGEVDNVVTVPSFEPYEDPASGDVLVVLIVLGNQQLKLKAVEVGAWEIRGLGAGIDPTPYPPAPDYPPFVFEATTLIDISHLTGPVGDQQSTLACTAWAATGAMNSEQFRLYGDCGWNLELPAFRMSPRYTYITTGSGEDSCPGGGRSTWDVANNSVDDGFVREVTAPWLSSEVEDPWDFPWWGFHCTMGWDAGDAATEAADFRPTVAGLIRTQDEQDRNYMEENQIQFAKDVIRILRRPLGMRVLLDNQFSNPDYSSEESWTFSNAANATGGHAMLVTGYDDSVDGGSFLVKNSWGTNWGDDGYCWINYDTFRDPVCGPYMYWLIDHFDEDVADTYCPVPPPFLPPFDLKVDLQTHDEIKISWQAVQGAIEYQIFRDEQKVPYATTTDLSFSDREVQDFNTHAYWVRGFSPDGGSGPFSNPLLAYKIPEEE